jgi:hypothetical protein
MIIHVFYFITYTVCYCNLNYFNFKMKIEGINYIIDYFT